MGLDIGVWVVAIAVLFVIGNVMGLKPKASEMRLGDMRLLARKKQLHPKEIAMPVWLQQNPHTAIGKAGMIAQYSLINDAWRLTYQRLIYQEGVWYCDGVVVNDECLQALTCMTMMPFIKAISLKSNSIHIFWFDEQYVKTYQAQDKMAMKRIEQDLADLYHCLSAIAEQFSIK